MEKINIGIIGGGASGLVAGIIALRNGANVTIFEKNAKIGRKILASGNGRCNVTNENIDISRYHGQNKNFPTSVLNQFQTLTCKKFFESIGVELAKNDNGRFYPLSLQSLSIAEALEYEFKSLGGVLHLDTFVKSIEQKGDKFYLHVKKFLADKILISCGSKAMSKLGSTESGYEFAKYFNHEITPTFASLVQLICKEDNLKASGVKFEGIVNLYVDKKEISSAYGDILLTKYGISGSAILDISRYASLGVLENKNVQISIDCMSKFSKEKLANLINTLTQKSPSKPLDLFLNGLINKKLANLILSRCKISSQKKSHELNKKDINSIIYTLKKLTFTVTDTKGFEFAEVVAGGINVKDINPKTLESKLVKNLYFSGEVLDIDGDCGGFNLHWAWASGYVCGKEMAK